MVLKVFKFYIQAPNLLISNLNPLEIILKKKANGSKLGYNNGVGEDNDGDDEDKDGDKDEEENNNRDEEDNESDKELAQEEKRKQDVK